MSTVDHSQVLAFYRALRVEAETEEAAHIALWVREPLEKTTRRIKEMVREYMEGYPRRMRGQW